MPVLYRGRTVRKLIVILTLMLTPYLNTFAHYGYNIYLHIAPVSSDDTPPLP